MRLRFLRAAGVGAAGLTVTGLAAVEFAQIRPNPAPCPLVSPGVSRSGPLRHGRADDHDVDAGSAD